jgi:hypothetical protein
MFWCRNCEFKVYCAMFACDVCEDAVCEGEARAGGYDCG